MKLSAVLFVATVNAQYDSNYDQYNDSNYAAQEYNDQYGSEYTEQYQAPAADDERRGTGARPNGKNYNTGGSYQGNNNNNNYQGNNNNNNNNNYGGNTGNTGASNGGSSYGGNAPADPNGPSGLTCWHCDAMSFEECEAKGQQKACHGHAESCFLEIRERRTPYGHIAQGFMQICMGCKQKEACTQMQNQNFQNQNPDYTQCRPETQYTDSVCRQCCDTNDCTKNDANGNTDWWYPTSRDEWAYTGEATAPATGTQNQYGGK